MKTILDFLKPYRWQIFWMLVLMAAQIFGTLYIPTLTADIVNKGIVPGNLNYVWSAGIKMLAIAFLSSATAVWATWVSTKTATCFGMDLRDALFKRTQGMSVHQFNEFGAASLITRTTNDVTQVQVAFSIIVEMLLPAPIMTIAGLVLAYSRNGLLASMLLVFMILILGAMIFVARKIIPIFEKLQNMLDGMNRKVRENITGVRVIRAFNQQGNEKEKTDGVFTDYANLAIKANKIFAALLPVIMLLMNGLSMIFIWFGAGQVAAGKMGIGDIMAIIEYAMLTLMYLIMGVAVFLFIPRAYTCAMRITQVLKAPVGLEQKATVKKEEADKDAPLISFDNVTFRYEGAQKPVLHDISFDVGKGTTTAIIGSTGSGKSTIANLLLRFHEIEDGSISVNGQDIRSMKPEELRAKIGYVPQKAFLFSGTIADNLKHGKPDATKEDMMEACRIAQMDTFIETLPEGLESPVSQGGTNFSGGQKQRLSIARAVIKKPEIYIFDDSFSALDYKTDANLRKALKKEVKDSALLIVAQRVSTIVDADQIIVLDEGRVVGKGTHDELMETCEIYRQIAKSQMKEDPKDGCSKE